MPIPETAAVLKSYFQTGDKPTQAQFADFIDTMFSIVQTAQDTADAAVAAAAASQKLRVLLMMTTNSSLTIHKNIGIDSVVQTAVVTGFRTLKFNFTDAFPDTNYFWKADMEPHVPGGGLPQPDPVELVDKNFAYVTLKCPVLSGRSNFVQLTIFDDYA